MGSLNESDSDAPVSTRQVFENLFFVSGTILGTFYMFYRFISPLV